MISQSNKQPEVIIIGGGFGGLEVAKGLKKAPVRVFLADRRNYHLFQPLLYQVATSVLSGEKIASPIRNVLRSQKNATVALAEIIGIDLEKQIAYGQRAGRHYDYLVIAAGLEQSYFGHDEFRANAPGLKSLDDAFEIRRRILVAFEEAEFEVDEVSRRGKLTFVIVGGGPTGVELAGSIIEIATRTLPNEFRHIDTKTARVILVDRGDHLLGGMPPEMGRRAQADLEALGVEIWLNRSVTSVREDGVMIGEQYVPAENVFWAAGVQGTSLADSLDLEKDRMGRVKVGPDLSIQGHPEIFVIGDAAHLADPETGKPVPAVAQGAIQMGQFVARIIRREVEGSKGYHRGTFRYNDKGSMATIARGRALASLNDRTFSGFFGWLMWGVVHIMFLVGFRSKMVVMMDWVWNYLVNERGARTITGDPQLKVKEVRGINMADLEN
ncbi:MAG: NAD(P)/FAD-dependent oxidoreductase [Chloroflexi bacterium]|nr:NAD(P)/FAD-dependent oxidoreductase [Chloroflexota bacterium]